MIDWNDFAREVHAVAVDKGWWDKPVSFDDVICDCLVHLGRAYEEHRNGRPNLYYPCNAGGVCEADKTDGAMDCGSRVINPDHPEIYCMAKSKTPSGVAVELADCVLRLLDCAAQRGFSIAVFNVYVDTDFTRFICSVSWQLTCINQAANVKDGLVCGHINHAISLILSWAAREGVDLESILRSKHEYNKTRPYRHGGKVL